MTPIDVVAIMTTTITRDFLFKQKDVFEMAILFLPEAMGEKIREIWLQLDFVGQIQDGTPAKVVQAKAWKWANLITNLRELQKDFERTRGANWEKWDLALRKALAACSERLKDTDDDSSIDARVILERGIEEGYIALAKHYEEQAKRLMQDCDAANHALYSIGKYESILTEAQTVVLKKGAREALPLSRALVEKLQVFLAGLRQATYVQLPTPGTDRKSRRQARQALDDERLQKFLSTR